MILLVLFTNPTPSDQNWACLMVDPSTLVAGNKQAHVEMVV
jgi:hypothetical protein